MLLGVDDWLAHAQEKRARGPRRLIARAFMPRREGPRAWRGKMFGTHQVIDLGPQQSGWAFRVLLGRRFLLSRRRSMQTVAALMASGVARSERRGLHKYVCSRRSLLGNAIGRQRVACMRPLLAETEELLHGTTNALVSVTTDSIQTPIHLTHTSALSTKSLGRLNPERRIAGVALNGAR